jgi:2-polyprenyl-3-methyl-5-hydroxy-6-metoxy-1,4-benzoquinol methylase
MQLHDTCLACGEPIVHHAVRWKIPDFELRIGPPVEYWRCEACHSLSQLPAPQLSTLAAWYPSNYFGKGSSFKLRQLLQRMMVRHRVRMALRMLPRQLGEPPRLLDFGAGDGTFLRELKRIDKRVLAIGYDKMARKYSSDADAIELVHSLDHLKGKLHLVTMHHVIEHLSSFENSLGEVAASLAPGGLLTGETPNAESSELTLFGRFWAGFHAPRHTLIFSKTGLARYLERVGLEVISIVHAANPAQGAISLAAMLRLPEPRFLSAWLLPLSIPLSMIESFSGSGNVYRFVARKVA